MASPKSRLALWREVLGKTFWVWFDRDAMTQSAALAFFTVFSLVPVLILVVRVAGLLCLLLAVYFALTGCLPVFRRSAAP